MMSLFQRIFGHSRSTKYFGGFLVLLLLAAIPVTLLLVSQRQDVRQRATGTSQATLYYALNNGVANPTAITSFTVAPGQTTSVRLFLDTQTIPIDGFDITIDYGTGITLNSINAGAGANLFSSPIFNTISPTTHTFRFSKVTTDININISGLLHIVTLSFTAGSAPTTGTLAYGEVDITSNGSALTLDNPNLNYTVAAGPSSTPGPSSSPTATPSGVPTATPILTLTPLHGDIDRNHCIGTGDYDAWEQAFLRGVPALNTDPDVHTDGVIDLLDFNEWYIAYQQPSTRCP